MATNEYLLTPEGKAELERELAFLEGEKSSEIIEELRKARDFGDLSENAEFDGAKDEQSRTTSRIAEIRTILANAKVVSVDDLDGSQLSVSINTVVELEDERGKKMSFTIVGTTQTDSLRRHISNESPAGKAMIGHVVGDRVSFTTPTGKVREYTITNITINASEAAE